MGLWTKKSLASLQHEHETDSHQLRRVLGAWDLIALGIGAIIGAGLFSITGVAAAQNAGPAIVLSFLVASIGCVFAGLCYSELASMIPIAGSAYTYAYASMGKFVAWMIGWTLILEYAIGAATVSISWSAYAISFLHDMNIELPAAFTASPWQGVHLRDGTLAYGWINLPAILILSIVSTLLITGIRQSSLVNTAIVTLKLAVVIVFIGFGAFYIQPENYDPFLPPNTGEFGSFGWSGVFRAAGTLFFAYIGFDAVSTAAQEAKNPQRDMPIAIIGSLAICTVLYVLFGLVLTGLVNYKELNVAAPVALAIDQTPFWWLNWLIKLAILAGFTSVMLVTLLGQSRIFYAMAKDGLLPAWFATLHPRFQTPYYANLVLLLLVSAFGGFVSIDLAGHMTSIGTLLAFIIVCIGVLILRYREPQFPRPFKVPFFPLTPILGIAACTLMMVSLDIDSWIRLVVWLAIGLLIYYTRRQPVKDS